MKKKIRIIISIALIAIILCGIYFYYENTNLEVSYYNITNNKIPKEFHQYKIVQVSDLHNTNSKRLINDLIKEIKNQNPNIIVLTGDLIDANRTDVEIAINFVEKINTIALFTLPLVIMKQVVVPIAN